MLEFTAQETGEAVAGLVLNLEEDNVGAAIMGDYLKLKEGDEVRRTGRLLEVPVGPAMLGRVVDALGRPVDGRGADPDAPSRATVEMVAPGHHRAAAGEGAAADRHQGDRRDDPDRPRPARADHRRPRHRQDRHRGRHHHQSEGHRRHLRLRRHRAEALDRGRRWWRSSRRPAPWTTPSWWSPPPPTPRRCSTSRPTPAAPSPSTSCTRKGKPTLCVYDDLSKQAAAYRQLSLILRRPPGREAYPGRRVLPPQPPAGARRQDLRGPGRDQAGPRIKKPGGSLTALPIIETQAGDVSAYIPTNVISITDGQIFLDHRPVLLQRPPRGGRRHQREPGGRQRADQGDEAGGRPAPARAWRSTASWRPSPSSAPTSTPATQRQLARGARAGRGAQAAAVPAGAGGEAGGDHLRRDQRLPRRRGRASTSAQWERDFLDYLEAAHPAVLTDIRTKKALDDDLTGRLKAAIDAVQADVRGPTDGQGPAAQGPDPLGPEHPQDHPDDGAGRHVKLKRAQDRVVAARPYAEALREVIADLVTPELADRFPLLRQPAPPSKGGPDRAAVILLTSNRGLAGAFNANLIKEARRRIEALEAEGYTVDLYGVGQEGHRLLPVLGPQARAWSGRTSATSRPRSTRPSWSTPLIEAFAAGRAGQRGPGPGPVHQRAPDAADDGADPAGGDAAERRREAGRRTNYILRARAPRRSWSSCCRSTCATRSIAGWWRPRRPSTARGAPR